MTVFFSLLNRWESAELNQAEAAELLGVSERTFRRWTRRYEEEGEAGLVDRRLGQASGKRVPADRAEEVEALYRERYQGFTVKHFPEHLVKDHGFGWGSTWLKLHLQWAGVAPKAPRKRAHRRKRERRPLPGMMLHQSLPPRRRGTARGTHGSRASRRSTSLSPWMTRRGRSIRPFSSRRKARPRPSGR
jgi:transposase